MGLGESQAESRFEALRGQHLTPLVGRDHELGILLERWAWAKDGDGQVMLLSGEPGIGKSRLTRSLMEHLAAEPHIRLRYYCSTYHTNSALYPVAEQLERAAGLLADDTAETRLDKLEAVLAGATANLAEVVPLIAALLLIPTGGRYPPVNLTPEAQKLRTFEVLLGQVVGLADQWPVLMVLEDAHWIDPTTSELFGFVIDRIQRLPVLLLITFRPELTPPWPGYSHVTSLTLSRLGQHQGAVMVERLTAGKALPAEVLQQILVKTDGVPLFVEELTKTVLDSGLLVDAGDHFDLSGPLPPLAIPATLHDSLMARLDRLAPVKEVAQTGAVIGREFSYELLAAVVPLDDNQLQAALAQLVASELIFRRGNPPHATYAFKHALVQDAAYQSLLKSRRRQLHGRIAAVIEERFPDTANTQPELVAHHYTEAGVTERAVAYWLKAGQRAARQSAHPEAIAHLRRGLNMLTSLPETPERTKQELAFQSTLGPVVMATQGYASPEAGETYTRARELCQLVGETEDIYPVLFGIWLFAVVRAHHQEATEVARELVERAQHVDDPGPRIAGHVARGISLVQTGPLSSAERHLEQAIALHDVEQHLPLVFRYSVELGTIANGYCAWSLWLLGYPDQALDRGKQTLALVERIKHSYTQSRALYWNAVLHHFRREWPIVYERAEAAMRSAAEHGFALVRADGQIMQGAALAAQGQGAAGSRQIREGLEAYRITGAWFRRPYHLALLAETLGTAGLQEQGLEALEEALDLAEKSGEHCYEAEIHRLKGELVLRLPGGHLAEAEGCFRETLEVARQQQAKSLELRAATSLARLWAEQGERRRAHDLLAPVYGWFTEGFDTADLEDAKALLGELS